MTKEERQRVGEQWMGLCYMIENRDIPRPALKMILDSVDDLPFEKVMCALGEWGRGKNFKSPLPGQIRDLIFPQADPRALASAVATRIRHAVGKYGKPNNQDAKVYIGDIGWKFVERFGGWEYLCENLGTKFLDSGTFVAQAREAIESDIKLERIGIDTTKPLLEQTSTSRITSVVKELTGALSMERITKGAKNATDSKTEDQEFHVDCRRGD